MELSRAGQRDRAGLGGRRLACPDRGGAWGIGAILQQRGAGGADGEGSHDEHSVPVIAV